MSGAAGHLMHLYDNRQLTFADIKEIIHTAASGKLEQVVEKLDGANLVFTWDQSSDRLLVARNSRDIKEGGRNSEELAAKFESRGNLSQMFSEAFDILESAIGVMTPAARTMAFGTEAQRWYSLEIVYSTAPITINYDSNNIIFHSWPVFEHSNGVIKRLESHRGSLIIERCINQMQMAVANKKWQVHGKIFINLNELSTNIPQKLLAKLDEVIANAGIDDFSTLEDYVRSCMREEVYKLRLPQTLSEKLIERSLKTEGCLTLTQLKKIAPQNKVTVVSEFVKTSEKLIKKFISPIERIVNDLALEVLKGVNSALISNPSNEICRLQNNLREAVQIIESSGDEETLLILREELNRLGSIDNIASAIEGIVFRYKGNSYKLTGAFAPMHQIMRLLKNENLKSKSEIVTSKSDIETLLKAHLINRR